MLRIEELILKVIIVLKFLQVMASAAGFLATTVLVIGGNSAFALAANTAKGNEWCFRHRYFATVEQISNLRN